MHECDICGRATEQEYVIEIEGALMHTCERCANGKTPIEVIDHSLRKEEKHEVHVSHTFAEGDQEVADRYGDIIKAARERLGMTNKDLAVMINERESLIARIERNQLVPEEKIVKKLEKALNIKLESSNKNDGKKLSFKKNEPITLWDAAVRKSSKKEEGE